MKEFEKLERDLDDIRALVIGMIYVEQKNNEVQTSEKINQLAKLEKELRFLKETFKEGEDLDNLIPELKMIGNYTLSEIDENNNRE